MIGKCSRVERLWAYMHEIAPHIRWLHLQAGNRAKVWQGGYLECHIDDEGRLDTGCFYLRAHRAIQVGDSQQVIVGKRGALASKELRIQANGGNTTSLAVPSIAHLLQRLK